MYILLDGMDGAGKSTVARTIEGTFKNKRKIFLTREPGGTEAPVAEKIREVIIHNNMDPMTELFLFNAARVENSLQVRRRLDKGDVVVGDRSFPSTYAYQYAGGGVTEDIVTDLMYKSLSYSRTRPNKIFLLLGDPEALLKRVENKNVIEEKGLEFHKKVREGYLEFYNKFSSVFDIVLIDDCDKKSKAEVITEIITKIDIK